MTVRYGIFNNQSVVRVIGEPNLLIRKYQVIFGNGEQLRFVNLENISHICDTREEANRTLAVILNPLAQEQSMGIFRDMMNLLMGRSTPQPISAIVDPVIEPVIEPEEVTVEPVTPSEEPVTTVDSTEEELATATLRVLKQQSARNVCRTMDLVPFLKEPRYREGQPGILTLTADIGSYARHVKRTEPERIICRKIDNHNVGYTLTFFVEACEMHNIRRIESYSPRTSFKEEDKQRAKSFASDAIGV